jgi:hypothetical protein
MGLRRAAGSGLPAMGLAAGDRPAADVEVLTSAVAVAEYELARRMHAAWVSGCLPLAGPGMMLKARTWSVATARRLVRAGALAAGHDSIAAAWAEGTITSEHVDAVASRAERFTDAELAAVVAELVPYWGRWSPAAIARFVREADRMLHPPEDDPEPDEAAVYASRGLSFAVTRDAVIFSGELPRLEGELVIAALDAFAEKLRSADDRVPHSARRADALVELVNAAHAAGSLPTRGGLPVSVTVTLEHTSLGHPLWNTSRGHRLTPSEERFVGCDAAVTPVVVDRGSAQEPIVCPDTVEELLAVADGREAADGGSADGAGRGGTGPGAGGPGRPAADGSAYGVPQRLAALAVALMGRQVPLAVGRTERTATAAQRRALAVRDRGCVIPGCGIVAEACQVHHVTEWAAGGASDPENMVLLCWAHHRQVDLRMWTIEPVGVSGSPPPPGTGQNSGAVAWPGNNGSPWVVRAQPRTRWRT